MKMKLFAPVQWRHPQLFGRFASVKNMEMRHLYGDEKLHFHSYLRLGTSPEVQYIASILKDL